MMILGCSALKEAYRKILRVNQSVRFIYLKGSYDLIQKRLEERKGHFFDPTLLDSQFATLEEPKDALVVDIAPPIKEIVREIKKLLPQNAT